MDINLLVVKTPRVSGVGEEAADHLSKGKFKEAFALSDRFLTETAFIPRTLVAWLEHPKPSRVLGQAMLEEMSDYTDVLRRGWESVEEVSSLVRRSKRKAWKMQ